MSITRAQIARQLYRAGGRTDAGANRSTASHSSRGSIDESGRSVSSSGGGNTNTGGGNQKTKTISPSRDEAIQNPFGRTRVNRNYIPTAAVNRAPPPDYLDDKEKEKTFLDKTIDVSKDIGKQTVAGLGMFKAGIPNPYGLGAMGLVNMYNRFTEDKAKRDSIDAKTADARLSGSFITEYNPTRTTRTGPTNDGGGDSMPMPIMPFMATQLPSDIESKPSDFDLYAALEGREAMNFGMNPNNMTGAMQRFSDGGEVRQRYGLGSFVRKIKRGVKKGIKGIKKFAKSDLGKAALLYAGGTYLGGTAAFGGGGDLKFLERLQNPGLLKNLANPLRAGQPGTFKLPFIGSGETELTEAQKVLLNKKKTELTVQDMLDIKKIPGIGGDKTSALVKYGIPAAMAASYMFTKNEEPDNLDEEMMENYKDTSGLKEQIASYPEYRFQVPEQYRLANGGRIGYDMGGNVGIMNLGGLEKDYREGGFVPIGVQEKADDVPARLSKNEFVFTADAVRAAGGGSVDKGADLMYKTMKNLESRVG